MLRRRLLIARGGGSFAGGVTIPDPRTYDDVSHFGGGSLTFTPLTRFGTDLYGRVIASTPGLVHFWRFATALDSLNDGADTSGAPYFLNSAGAELLGKSSGSPTQDSPLTVNGLGSVRLNSGSLWAFNYFLQPGAHEVGSFEAWFSVLTALPSDGGICGQWKTNVGWVMGMNGSGQVWCSVGTAAMISSAGAVAADDGAHHLVAVVGGTQVPDFRSRLYLDGVEVATADYTGSQQLYTQNDQFRVGQYAGGVASSWDGYVSEVAIYSRMLQPDEVYQHYQAGIGVLWP